MRIVCDTNVLISGFLFPGSIPDKIIRATFSRRFIHLTSPDILTELRRVFEIKFELLPKKIEWIIELIVNNGELIYPSERLSVIAEDEADNRILECAVFGKATHIVSGDKHHLLPLKQYKSIDILSPRQFAELTQLL